MPKGKKYSKEFVLYFLLPLAIVANYYIINYILDYIEISSWGEIDRMVESSDRGKYKTNKFINLKYVEVNPKAKLENLKMIGYVSRYGVIGKDEDHQLHAMILRCLRYQNISRKVEIKYGLPKNIILAIMMKESGGADLLPNSMDDGGIGLCHIQPSIAREFGLRTYENCRELRCVYHGRKLRQLIYKYKDTPEKLILFDDRFHPLFNIDAVGRMLAFYIMGEKYKNTPIKTGIYRFSGKKRFKEYYEKVMYYKEKLDSDRVLKEIKNEFNQQNKKFTINGVKADFDAYIQYSQNQNYNYGLAEYK